MKVQIYKNLFGFVKFLICVDNKEIFIHNSFENVQIALICLEKNSIDRKEVWLNKIKGNLILEQDLSLYISENQLILENLKQELTQRNKDYSWLQMMQLMILNNDSDDLDSNINNLKRFYDENIIKELII